MCEKFRAPCAKAVLVAAPAEPRAHSRTGACPCWKAHVLPRILRSWTLLLSRALLRRAAGRANLHYDANVVLCSWGSCLAGVWRKFLSMQLLRSRNWGCAPEQRREECLASEIRCSATRRCSNHGIVCRLCKGGVCRRTLGSLRGGTDHLGARALKSWLRWVNLVRGGGESVEVAVLLGHPPCAHRCELGAVIRTKSGRAPSQPIHRGVCKLASACVPSFRVVAVDAPITLANSGSQN